MSLLFETIRLEDGVLFNLEYHNYRFNRSREVLFGERDNLFLENLLVVPSDCRTGVYKCKVAYSSTINEIEIIPYEKRVIESSIWDRIEKDAEFFSNYYSLDGYCGVRMFLDYLKRQNEI